MLLYFCNFLCSKLYIRLFAPQIMIQMDFFAYDFLWARSCSRWVFLHIFIGAPNRTPTRGIFCAPNRAPDKYFLVIFFYSIQFFNCSNYLHPLRARGSPTFFQNRVFFRECFCTINRVFFFYYKDIRRKRKIPPPRNILNLYKASYVTGLQFFRKCNPFK